MPTFVDTIRLRLGSFSAVFQPSTMSADVIISAPTKTGTMLVDADWALPGSIGATTPNAIRGYRPIVSATVSKTFALTDAGTYNYCTNAAAATLTVPLNSVVAFPIGSEIEVKKGAAGTLSIAATGGVTINRDGGTAAALPLALTKGCTLKKVATDTWILEGS